MKKQQGHFIILCPNTPELHSAVAHKMLIFARMGTVDYGECDYCGFYGECEYGGCVRVRVRIRVSGWDMGWVWVSVWATVWVRVTFAIVSFAILTSAVLTFTAVYVCAIL